MGNMGTDGTFPSAVRDCSPVPRPLRASARDAYEKHYSAYYSARQSAGKSRPCSGFHDFGAKAAGDAIRIKKLQSAV
jgi:hypothetical protein